MSLFEEILGTAGTAAGDLFGPDNNFRRSGTAPGAHKQPAGVKAPPAAARAMPDVQGSAIATEKPRKKRKAELQKQGGELKDQITAKLTCYDCASSGVTQSLSVGRSGPEDAAGSPDTSQAAPSKKRKATKAAPAEENGATAAVGKLEKRKKKHQPEDAAGSLDTSQAAHSKKRKATKAAPAEETGAAATLEKLGKRKMKQQPAASQLIATPAGAVQGKPPAAQEAVPAKKQKASADTAVDTPLDDKAATEDGDKTTDPGLQQVCVVEK